MMVAVEYLSLTGVYWVCNVVCFRTSTCAVKEKKVNGKGNVKERKRIILDGRGELSKTLLKEERSESI